LILSSSRWFEVEHRRAIDGNGTGRIGRWNFVAASGGGGISRCCAGRIGKVSAAREKETEQTLKMMFDLGCVKPEEVAKEVAEW